MPLRRPPGPVPRLLSLATAAPSHALTQAEVVERAARIFAPLGAGFHRLAPVYRNAEIETRRVSAPADWFEQPHSFGERNTLFLERADALLEQAATAALAQAGLAPADVDQLVVVSTSGVATPALDARLMQLMPFRRDVRRLPIFGLGCAGGVIGLSRAAQLARADPGSRVLFLVVELCSLTFRHQDRSKSNIVATALFADGAAGAVLTCRADAPADAPQLGADGEHTWPDSLDVMGWDVADDGLKVVFSRDIPTLVRQDLRPVVDAFLARQGGTFADIDGLVCHPGGAKVLDALEQVLDQPARSLVHARQVLRDYGNMSAATVLFVLKAALDAGARGTQLLTTLGPGFTAGLLLLHVPERT